MNGEEFALTLFEKMPEVYKTTDANYDNFLQKYLDAISVGLSLIMDDINDFKSLVFNPLKCKDDYIPVLCDCFYIPYYRDIPTIYYRKLLNDISSLRIRKGTTNCVQYLCRALTGLDVEIDPENTDEHVLEIVLSAETLSEVLDIDVTTEVLGKFIKDFIPFYIHTVNITSEVTESELSTNLFSYSLNSLEKDIELPVYTYII